MTKGKWIMKANTNHELNTIEFTIVDTHHSGSFYGEWTAKDKDELEYHLKGLQECMDQGTYRNNDFMFNGEQVNAWHDFKDKMYDFFGEGDQKKSA